MFIRSSCFISDHIGLLTIGHTCRYLIAHEAMNILIDPGASVHVPALLRRLETFAERSVDRIDVICMTHLHADRIGAIPYLRQKFPKLSIVGTAAMQKLLTDQTIQQTLFAEDQQIAAWFEPGSLPMMNFEQFSALLQIDRVLKDGDVLPLGEGLEVRLFSFPGHHAESAAYLIEPEHFLIGDEGLGYYQGRELAGLGADDCLDSLIHSIHRLDNHELHGLCFPCFGVITGDLVPKHMAQLMTSVSDLKEQCSKALSEGIAAEHILNSIREAFFKTTVPDPIVRFNMERSFAAIWKQIHPQ